MEANVKDIAVSLAKDAVENFIMNGHVIEAPAVLSGQLDVDSCGVFVTLKSLGQLRGCIGTIAGTGNTVKKDIIINAISAATRDPRFSPVTRSELDKLSYSVDVLQAPFSVSDISELDPKSYGVIVRKSFRQGVLLPDIEGVKDVDHQLAIACQKAGISIHEDPEIFAFKVVRYGEK